MDFYHRRKEELSMYNLITMYVPGINTTFDKAMSSVIRV